MNQKNRQDRSVLVLLLVVIVLSAFIYKNYRDNLTSSEEIGAYISKTTRTALLVTSRNTVWEYKVDNSDLLNTVEQNQILVSAYDSIMYSGNETFSNVNKYVEAVCIDLKALERAIKEGDDKSVARAQMRVAYSMKQVRASAEALEEDIAYLDLEDEAIDRAWHEAFLYEKGPIAEILKRHFPKMHEMQ